MTTPPQSLPRAPADLLGNVHSYESGSMVDGPGVRFVVFLAGCPLRCDFCHNPDTWNAGKACAGQPTSAADVLRKIEPYARFLSVSGGGVTLSGGEPLLQQDFAAAIATGCKALGLHVAIETSGYRGQSTSTPLLNSTDLVILDVKSFNPDTYRRLTHIPQDGMIALAEHCSQTAKPMWLSVILIPGLTDHPAELADLAKWAKSLGTVQKIVLHPFHQLGANKWAILGKKYPLEGHPPATPEDVEKARKILKQSDLPVE